MSLNEYELVIYKPQRALAFDSDSKFVTINDRTTARLFAKTEEELAAKVEKFYSGYPVISTTLVDKY